MCCSTGVCGPGVDPELLLRMATMVSNPPAKSGGKDIKRHTWKEPQALHDNAAVNDVILAEEEEAASGSGGWRAWKSASIRQMMNYFDLEWDVKGRIGNIINPGKSAQTVVRCGGAARGGCC